MLDPKLDTLLLVAEKRNFTRAAQALSLTQPAVSHHISQLEQELGVRLFVRGNGDLMLTPEGETVLRYVRRMKALEKKMAEELQEAGRRLTRLRIGSPTRRRAALWQRYWPVTPMKTPVSP